MTHGIQIRSLDIAAAAALDGNDKNLQYLNTIAKDASVGHLDNAIGVIVASSNAEEPAFLKVLECLVKNSSDGESTLKEAISAYRSPAAVFLVNSYATEAQKSDFFAICKSADNAAIIDAIKQFGFGFANKVVDETGRTGLHIAIANNSQTKPDEIIATFRDFGFDFNVPDKDGITPLMLALKNINFAKAIILDPKIKLDFEKKDNLGKSVLDYCDNPGVRELANNRIEQESLGARFYVPQNVLTPELLEASEDKAPSTIPSEASAALVLLQQGKGI